MLNRIVMKKIFVVIFFILYSFNLYAQLNESDFLHKFTEKIEKATSYSFFYKSGITNGEVVIANSEMYVSQKGKLEIYEKGSTRFTHNIKRAKVDIDKINDKNNGGIVIFNWIKNIDNYKLKFKDDSKKEYIIYNLENKSDEKEKIEISFDKKGELKYIVYQNKSIKKIKVNIIDFQIDEKTPAQFFKFNPDLRDDLEVTDYR